MESDIESHIFFYWLKGVVAAIVSILMQPQMYATMPHLPLMRNGISTLSTPRKCSSLHKASHHKPLLSL